MMKVILFLKNKIKIFKLPTDISGSFSFDEDKNSDAKLINIEAKDGFWYLYSTSDSSIIEGNNIIPSKQIEEKHFYVLQKNEDSNEKEVTESQKYLIYIASLYENNILTYKFDTTINILFGNTQDCNVKLNSLMTTKENFSLKYENDSLVITKLNNSLIYLNEYIIQSEKQNLKIGDVITFYDINITILSGILLITNPLNQISVNETSANIKFCELPKDTEASKEEIKDKNLYTEDSYFFKSPRLRRTIETKKIKIDPPPKENSNDEAPLLLTIAPMLTMAITSITTLATTIQKINSGQTSLKDSAPQLITGISMLLSTLLWPLITKMYNNYIKKKKRKELIEKYNKYLENKEKELKIEKEKQREILIENLIDTTEVIKMLNTRGMLFWNKRNDENDFLTVRVGYGNAKLDVEINFSEEGFTIDEDELRKLAENLVKKYELIENVPVGYSFYKNITTAIMGDEKKSEAFINNMILQLATFYSYEDLKIVVFTNEDNERKWDYIKYLNHNFTNQKEIRFFSTNSESAKSISEILNHYANSRSGENNNNSPVPKPYFLIIVDDYEMIKRQDFVKTVTETGENIGFSIIIVENRLRKLPSKCNNYISLTGNQSTILKNTYEEQEQVAFKDEINYNINMMDVAKILSNIPIEFEEGIKQLPNAVTFLEMEQVGKVEQLNILNRWNTNDPTTSLKAEVGVDESGNHLYLDLHEKYHGPHGLIAGTTGSGKSEFIITYILSMAINYSPEYVSFILIDYKGGGLAGAFENKTTGISLPHLAGTITNLDKAEMDRTLVSIDSEVKRRQAMFNETRDKLGESTIDIYKYERFYREGKITVPIPHLFIICDEFAELKAQQPEFMENLISVARIGRSLGVHLILATQKPSGVVNDQIWSNTKFRVCLKVADEADSKEMLKRPEAAHIKQTGRFYLQVGMDEIFLLGQSGWCGAKYYPSNKIVKEVDKSINFIDCCGRFIKSIQASSKSSKTEAQGEQLGAIMKEIISVSNKIEKKASRLWLENIPPIILVDDIIKKYSVNPIPYEVKAILGEYDAPEKQEQGILEYNILEDGNTIIYGVDSGEKEMLLSTIIYSTIKMHSPEEINYYILDYGSESLRKFANFPHIGGMVFNGEDEKFKNLVKLIKNEISERKKLFIEYGGEYKNYNKSSGNKLPLKIIIFNNYDSINENIQSLYEILPEIVRDSERYGIIFIFTANAQNSILSKISQNFSNCYAFKMKEASDYTSIFNTKKRITPRDIEGRGIVKNGEVHEFQTCNITRDIGESNEYLMNFAKQIKEKYNIIANKIPTLPEQVTFDIIKNYLTTINEIPVGISKAELEVSKLDLSLSPGILIGTNKIKNMDKFLQSFIYETTQIPNTDNFFIDGLNKISQIKALISNYYSENFDKVIEELSKYLNSILEQKVQRTQIIYIYGIDKFLNKLSSKSNVEKLTNIAKKSENIKIIIMEEASKIKTYMYEPWYSSCFSNTDGVWVGKGISDQGNFKLTTIKKEYLTEIKNEYGYLINDGTAEQIKLIDFTKHKEGEENGK